MENKKSAKPVKIVFTMANNSYSEYFDRFADMARQTKGVEVSFVCLYPQKPQMIEDLGKRGCKVYWVKYDANRRKRGMIYSTFQLYKLFSKLKPDVVHSILFDDAVVALTAAKFAGVKARIISKCDTGFHHRYAPFWLKFDRYNNAIATHVVTISQENDALVREVEAPNPRKIHLIPSGLDAEGVTYCPPEMDSFVIDKYRIKEFDHVVLKVARMIEWKGFAYLVEAMPMVLQKFPKTLFILMGEGPERSKLEHRVRELQIEKNVIFGGYVGRPELNGLYHAADVHVHAATLEPFGGVITEAMLNAVPLVTTPSGISKECIKHMENGYLVTPEASSIAAGINWVLGNPEKASQMGLKGQETALNEHTKEINWQRHMNLYASIFKHAKISVENKAATLA